MKQIIRRVAALVIGLGLGAVALAGLETVTHISDLNASWPLGSDLASTSDDHIRNIKTALKNDFPNVNGAVNPTPAQFNQLTSNTFTSAVTGNSFTPTSSTIPANGIYLPAANTIGFSSNTTKWGSVNSTGNWVLVAPTSGTTLTVNAAASTNSIVGGLTQIGDGAINTGANVYTSSTNVLSVGTAGAAALDLVTSATNRLTIGSSGNITITVPTSGTTLTASVISGATGVVFGKTKFGDDVLATGAGAFSSSTDPFNFGTLGSAASAWYTNDVARIQVSSSGASIQGYGPTAAGLVDMTPDTGTFTATMTGGTTSPTCTARWTRVGNLVMLEICSATAASNSTSFTYTGLPSAVQPTVTQHIPAASSAYEDNSATLASTVEVVVTASSGTITFWKNGASTGWTNLNVKGITASNTVSYLLN